MIAREPASMRDRGLASLLLEGPDLDRGWIDVESTRVTGCARHPAGRYPHQGIAQANRKVALHADAKDAAYQAFVCARSAGSGGAGREAPADTSPTLQGGTRDF